MKKRPLTASFEELMKKHYGGRRLAPRGDIAGSAERLFARYYGASAAACDRKGRAKAASSLSLSYDDGETLQQHRPEEQFEEYVVQQSVADDVFEEYVVEAGSSYDERVAGEGTLSLGSSLSTEGPAGGKLDAIPAEDGDPKQECQVDIFPPPRRSNIPAARATQAAAAPQGEPVRARERASDGGRQGEPLAAQSSLPNLEASQSASADDDFMADIQSILSGQMVYDPGQKKTVKKEELGQPPSGSGQNDRDDRNGRRNEPPAPEARNTQAIFDRIAQSMQYANAYDLGTVELENRFADFDKISEIEERTARERKTKPGPKSTSAVAAGVPAVPTVDSADFIRDLDAIRQKSSAPGVAPAAVVSVPMSLPVWGGRGARDTGCTPLALSLSSTDDPAAYSRPLYETGEHVRTGWDLYTDQLRVGKSPGVLFSYGEIISMGDLYQSVSHMMSADVSELQTLKKLIKQSTSHYMGESVPDVKEDKWQEATNKRYLDLAEDNYHHFSPDYLFADTAWGKGVGKKLNNKVAWEKHHRWAIEEAQKMFLAPENANRTFFPEWPLIINAFGDHFLTDAFSAGHVINKEAIIEYYKYNFYEGDSLKSASKKFFDRVAELAFKGELKAKFSALESYEGLVLDFIHPVIDSAGKFSALLKKIAEQRPDQIGNLAVKALHDRLNTDGVEVTNDAGDGKWLLTGDGMLDGENLKIIQKAVQQSVDNINDPAINAGNLNFQTFYTKVWNHVPRLTEDSKKWVKQLAKDYTSPDSEVLIAAASALITEKCDMLIEKLVEAKKLRAKT